MTKKPKPPGTVLVFPVDKARARKSARPDGKLVSLHDRRLLHELKKPPPNTEAIEMVVRKLVEKVGDLRDQQVSDHRTLWLLIRKLNELGVVGTPPKLPPS